MQQQASSNPELAGESMPSIVVSDKKTSTPDEELAPYYAMGTTTGVPPVPPNDNDDDDDHTISPSIVSSVMTADGIHDTTGFAVVCLIILVGDMSRGIFFPTLWPLVSELGGSEVSLGYCVAAFSFGRILVSPIFGQWSITYGYTKTLLTATCILFVATLLMAQAQNVGRLEYLILAQGALGVGSGTLGVTRAFVAEITAQRNRTTYLAWITAVQYGGFTVTPIIGSIFASSMRNWEYRYGLLRFNMFTAPAYLLSLIVAGTIFILVNFFKDRQRMQTKKKKSSKQAQIEDYANQQLFVGVTRYDCCILGCMLLNIATKGSISSFETLGIKLAMARFNMESSRAGVIVGTCGTFGVMALLSMGTLSRTFNDVQLISIGLLIMTTGIASLEMLDNDGTNAPWRWWLAIFLIYAVGYPIGHTAVIGLFSKIVGRRKQGVYQGWFSSAGSLSRITFPIMSGYVFGYFGPVVLFYILICILGTATLFVVWSREPLLTLSR